jgi:hypothetical protein
MRATHSGYYMLLRFLIIASVETLSFVSYRSYVPAHAPPWFMLLGVSFFGCFYGDEEKKDVTNTNTPSLVKFQMFKIKFIRLITGDAGDGIEIANKKVLFTLVTELMLVYRFDHSQTDH